MLPIKKIIILLSHKKQNRPGIAARPGVEF